MVAIRIETSGCGNIPRGREKTFWASTKRIMGVAYRYVVLGLVLFGGIMEIVNGVHCLDVTMGRGDRILRNNYYHASTPYSNLDISVEFALQCVLGFLLCVTALCQKRRMMIWYIILALCLCGFSLLLYVKRLYTGQIIFDSENLTQVLSYYFCLVLLGILPLCDWLFAKKDDVLVLQ